MKWVWVIILAIGISVTTMAQGRGVFTIRGKVVDADSGHPIPYVTVAVVCSPFIEKMVKGVVTDKEGEFGLVVEKGDYHVIVRSLGYRNFTKSLSMEMAEEVQLGVIALKIQPEMLEMVTVKPLVEVAVDEIKYNLSEDPDRETMSLHAILDKVPLIHRSPMGRLYVEEPGKKFLVVRNGKVDAMFSGDINDILKAVPAKGFETVTVMLAPPERYGDYDYVVNIVTDKNARLYGAIGLFKGEGYGNTGEVKPELSVMASLNKLRMSLGGNFQNTNAPLDQYFIKRQQLGEEMIYRQSKKVEASGEKWETGGYFSYDLAEQHFVNWRLGYGKEYRRDKSSLRSGYDGAEEEVTDFVKRKSDDQWAGGIDYQFDMGASGKVLNLAYQLSILPDEYWDIGNERQILMQNKTVEKQTEHAVQIHYYNPFSRALKLESGCGYLYRYNSSATGEHKQPERGESDLMNRMESRKHIMNVYMKLNYLKSRFSIAVGLKADYLYDGNGTLIETGDRREEVSETGYSFMPECRISVLFPGCKFSRLSLNYQLWHSRPSLKMLSVYEDFSNPDFIRRGNPGLKDETRHQINVNTGIGGLRFNASWVYSGNLVGVYWYQDEYGRTIQTYGNYGYQSAYTLSCNYHYNYKGISCDVMGNGGYTHSEMVRKERQEDWKVHVSGSLGYVFKNQFATGINAIYHDRFSSGYSAFQLPAWGLGCWIQKKLFKERVELEVRCTDVIHFRYKTERVINTDDFNLVENMEHNNLPLSLKISYRLGSYKVKAIRKIRKGIVIDDRIKE